MHVILLVVRVWCLHACIDLWVIFTILLNLVTELTAILWTSVRMLELLDLGYRASSLIGCPQ